VAKNIVIAVLAVVVVVLGAMLAQTNQVDATATAGTMGLAADAGADPGVEEIVVKARRADGLVDLNSPKVALQDLGLLPRAITVQRTAATPERVRLDFDYQYYLSRCADLRFEFEEPGVECPEYVLTDQLVSGGARVMLDFSEAGPLSADRSENIKLQFSMQGNDRLFTYAEFEDAANRPGYKIAGNQSTKLRFVWQAAKAAN